MTIEQKMLLVLDLAEEGMKQGEIPIAAIIFHGDEIISKAYTTEKRDGRYLVHAEMLAMLDMDKGNYPFKIRKEMQLFTNLEPCTMCYGASIHSFIGSIYYSIDSPTDGGTIWAEHTWDTYHTDSIFKKPKVYKGILMEESKELFRNYLSQYPSGGISDWVKTLL